MGGKVTAVELADMEDMDSVDSKDEQDAATSVDNTCYMKLASKLNPGYDTC